MSVSSERLNLIRTEAQDVRTGLNRIVNGVAEIRVNNRRSPDMIYHGRKLPYVWRTWSDEMFAIVLSVRNRLTPLSGGSSAKLRLNHFELAACAFALRIVRDRTSKQARHTDLERRIELLRKRAKRAMISLRGREEYDRAAHQWQGFTAWVRFNILPLRMPRVALARAVYKEQRDGMFSLAKETMLERCGTQLPEQQLKRLVKLAIREIRRKRHKGLRVRTLLSDPESAKNFLFAFIRKRAEVDVKYPYMSWVEQASDRAERFRKSLVCPEPPPSPYVSIRTIPEVEIVKEIAAMFRDHIPRTDWGTVLLAMQSIGNGNCSYPSQAFSAKTLRDAVQLSKPSWQPEDGPEHVTFEVEWLNRFLTGIGASSHKAASLSILGFNVARAEVNA
jgi:hypothetical protein